MSETNRLRRAGALPPWAVVGVLVLALAVLGLAAVFRGTEYDENYSVFVTGGIPRPDWPSTSFVPDSVAQPFVQRADQATILEAIRRTDVHPPLYFQLLGAWREVAGDRLVVLRLPSILATLGTLAVWMLIAARAGQSAVLTGLMLTFCYGFMSLGYVVRGYALAQFLIALSVLAAVTAWRQGRGAWVPAALAGLAGGLACLTNYLAVFPLAAVLGWLVLAAPGWPERGRRMLAAGLPFLSCMLLVALVWLDQQKLAVSQSAGQFAPFSLADTLHRLLQFETASVLGGLPLYVQGMARSVAGTGLALLLGAIGLLTLWLWRGLGPLRWVWLLGGLAAPAGLVLLGALFGNAPVELRYLVLGLPFTAALIAVVAEAWQRRSPTAAAWGLGVLLLVQATGTAGMIWHPATRQPYRDMIAALRLELTPGTVVMVPFGQDGVGLVGSMLRELPGQQPVLVLRDGDAAAAPARAAGFDRLLLLGFGARDRASDRQWRSAAAKLREAPEWHRAGLVWQEQRGGSVEIFEQRVVN